MKTTNRTLIAALAGVAMFAFTSPVLAQYRPTGADGITASPKVRAQLNERNARTASVSTPASVMACPKCKDALVAQTNKDPKGLGARTLTGSATKLVVQHLCQACAVDWTVVGTGKARQSVASHKCTSCGAENLACCSPKGASVVVTKGMEKKIEIAPLK
jgi:NMD protein affecting ribosome stability and mRNA decay